MDQIIGEIGKAIGGFFGSAPVQFALQAIAVYLITLKRTSGGIVYDLLQRLARRQREIVTDAR